MRPVGGEAKGGNNAAQIYMYLYASFATPLPITAKCGGLSLYGFSPLLRREVKATFAFRFNWRFKVGANP